LWIGNQNPTADVDSEVKVPAAAIVQSGLQEGYTISARAKTYGLELINAQTREVFLLVLRDEVYKEMMLIPLAS
jgi:hypothetical protein